MAVTLNPYLSFKDNALAAMEFYKSVFGGELEARTFKDFKASKDPGEDNLIMHAELNGDNNIHFFAADTPQRLEYKPGSNFSMSLSGDDEATLRGYYDKLKEGGKVVMPLEKALWGDTFGMMSDKFGITWLINITAGEETNV